MDIHASRRYDLDWLRVLAFSLLIVFHTGMMFNTWNWHVKNNVTTDFPELPMYFLHQWRMPLLFMISGSAVFFLLRKFSVIRFLRNRFTRLFVPLAFGMFVVIPPQVYYERLFHEQSFSSFFDFYSTIFSFVPYPQGNFSWHHLWYIPYIFVFSIITLPLFISLTKRIGERVYAAAMKWSSHGMNILYWFIPLGVSQVILRPFWPSDENSLIADWSNFAWSLLFFCYGYLLVADAGIWKSIERLRFKTLLIGIFAFSYLAIIREFNYSLSPVELIAYRMLRGLNAWSFILTILGFAYQYRHRNSAMLRYANEAVYPFYILHQTITVVLAYYLSPLQFPIMAKFIVVAIGTFAGCWILFEGIVKRFSVLRIVFGMGIAKKNVSPSSAPATSTDVQSVLESVS